jgi:uncharacterized protein
VTSWLLALLVLPMAPPRALSVDWASFVDRLLAAAIEQTKHAVRYDGSYRRIAYPGGDVPPDVGVCTDLVVRAYRAVGVDLQRLVHEDMRSAFSAYPALWGLTRPDANIDHRRVPNLQVFFARRGVALPVSTDPADTAVSGRPLIVHNIGRGPELEDMLFDFEITGHYRYRGE